MDKKLIYFVFIIAVLAIIGTYSFLFNKPNLDGFDKCDIEVDAVIESELNNFQCEQIEGCEWRSLGGKKTSYYACCPKNSEELLKIVDGKPIYRKCLILLD